MEMRVPREDFEVGLEVYKTRSPPLTGRIRKVFEDFVVRERVERDFMKALRKKRTATHRISVYHVTRAGRDTPSLARLISSHLHISTSKIRFLGLKDSRALSSQIFCVLGSHGDLEAGNFMSFLGWSERMPTKRVLIGNEFEVVIRELERSFGEAEETLRGFIGEMGVDGLPNFYGYQRFGVFRRLTHLVGEKIVRGRYGEAVTLYLTHTTASEPENTRSWRESLRDEGDFRHAYKSAPRRLTYERRMLRELVNHPGDYVRAIRAIPNTIRRLIVNAFQSYLFNRVLSARIEENLPLRKPVRGDFIYDPTRSRITRFKGRRRDIPRCRILIPLFGYGYRPSEGIQGTIEKRVLGEADVSPRSFYLRDMPEVSGRGGFRPADLRPTNLLLLHDGRSNIVKSFFTLEKGSYATVLLRELIKPSNPFLQGF
ncbi:MAG: tRNA pseudouridine(13) synthase TruD [Candidatus Geothermarchaeales archaeon]